MKISKIMAAAVMLFSMSSMASMASSYEWDYKMERNPVDGHYIKNLNTDVIYPRLHGTFTNEARYATMSLKLKSFGYFSANNIGHIVLMVGMKEWNSINHSGNGIIIGNVSEYGQHSGICKGNPRVNAVSVETFFPYGNCVYPDDNGLTFRDGVEYTITITIDNTMNTVRTQIVDEYGDHSDITVNTAFSDVALRGKYWAVKEVMSKHSWSIYISEPVVTSHW